MTETLINSVYARYRVFIFGQEVTSDVMSVAINQHDGRAPSTCSITLVSPYDRYIVTPYDIITQHLGGTVSGPAVNNNVDVIDPLNTKVSSSSRPASGAMVPVVDPVKAAVITAKRSAVPVMFRPPAYEGVPNPPAVPALRYPFQSGKPIFHPNDPVRVFFSDPVDPNKWYYMFCGLVSDFSEEVTANNDNTLTVVCESAAKWLRYGRFTANPGIVDIKGQLVQDAVVEDVASRTAFASLFNNRTLPEIFFAMLFGDAAFGDSTTLATPQKSSRQLDIGKAPNNASGQATLTQNPGTVLYERVYSMGAPNGATLARNKWGIGHIGMAKLNHSRVFIYGDTDGPDSGSEGIPSALGPPVEITNLSDYQDYIDHQVLAQDLVIMRADGVSRWPIEFNASQDSTNITDVIRYIGQHPEIYPTDAGRLIMLLPKSLGAARRSIVTSDLINGSFGLNTEWSTRGEILYDIVDRIQFVFYVSPRGDFVVEFPLYDFMPSQFNHTTDTTKQYGDAYAIGTKNTRRISATFTDSKVMTQAACSPTAIYNFDKSVADNSDILNKAGLQQVITLWHLIPLYGVRPMPVMPLGYINTISAAQLYALICLNKTNCEAYTQAVDVDPIFTAWLNRPYYIQRRNHIGCTRSITHTITWGRGGDMSTSLGLGAMRGWDGSVDKDNRMVFTPIGGREGGRPFRYDILFQQRDTKTPNQSSVDPVDADNINDPLGVQPPIPRNRR